MTEDPFGLGFGMEEPKRPPEPKPDAQAEKQEGQEQDRPADAPAVDAPPAGAPATEMEATWAVPDPEPETKPESVAVSSARSADSDGQVQGFASLLEHIASHSDLGRAKAATALRQIMSGAVSDIEVGAFLMGLRVKGETANEVAGFLEVMREMVVPVTTEYQDSLVDIVGTGGDQLGTFNISTAAAFVVAAAGVKVAKHGNRAASSRCGSADVLEAMGVRTDLSPGEVATCVDEVGMGFMLASQHHPAMDKVAEVRRTLGVRTIFNLLGPLTNPAGAQRLVLGVSSIQHLEVLAGALARVGCTHALLVHSDEGMDELSVSSSNTVVEVERGVVQPPYSLAPEECGVQRWALRGMLGGDPAANAFMIKGIFSGSTGAPRDAVILNAGAALYVAGAVSAIKEGVELAGDVVTDGRATKVLEDLVALTGRLAEGRA